MEVPCPVPLSQPWSPMGYQIVELPQAAGPPGDASPGDRGTDAPPQVTLAESAARTPLAPRPRSAVGYRVVMVADEQLPVQRSSTRPAERFRARPSIAFPSRKPGSTPAAVWIPLAAVGVIVVMPALALALMIATRTPTPPRGPQANLLIAPNEIVVPEALRANPAVALKADDQEQDLDLVAKLPPGILPNDVCEDCAQDERKAAGARRQVHDREGFATAVAFARNPQEAGRIARAEDKLTFILHLSGNFEDPGFT